MFWLRNKKKRFQLHTLIWGPVLSALCSNEVDLVPLACEDAAFIVIPNVVATVPIFIF